MGFDVKYWYYRKTAKLLDWKDETWNGSPGGPDANPDDSKDPYLLFGHFFNGMPPNPAAMPTPNNPDDDLQENDYVMPGYGSPGGYASNHPNWWYLPRMMQVRMKFTDKYNVIEQPFVTRIYLPASDPRPKVEHPSG